MTILKFQLWPFAIVCAFFWGNDNKPWTTIHQSTLFNFSTFSYEMARDRPFLGVSENNPLTLLDRLHIYSPNSNWWWFTVVLTLITCTYVSEKWKHVCFMLHFSILWHVMTGEKLHDDEHKIGRFFVDPFDWSFMHTHITHIYRHIIHLQLTEVCVNKKSIWRRYNSHATISTSIKSQYSHSESGTILLDVLIELCKSLQTDRQGERERACENRRRSELCRSYTIQY